MNPTIGTTIYYEVLTNNNLSKEICKNLDFENLANLSETCKAIKKRTDQLLCCLNDPLVKDFWIRNATSISGAVFEFYDEISNEILKKASLSDEEKVKQLEDYSRSLTSLMKSVSNLARKYFPKKKVKNQADIKQLLQQVKPKQETTLNPLSFLDVSNIKGVNFLRTHGKELTPKETEFLFIRKDAPINYTDGVMNNAIEHCRLNTLEEFIKCFDLKPIFFQKMLQKRNDQECKEVLNFVIKKEIDIESLTFTEKSLDTYLQTTFRPRDLTNKPESLKTLLSFIDTYYEGDDFTGIEGYLQLQSMRFNYHDLLEIKSVLPSHPISQIVDMLIKKTYQGDGLSKPFTFFSDSLIYLAYFQGYYALAIDMLNQSCQYVDEPIFTSDENIMNNFINEIKKQQTSFFSKDAEELKKLSDIQEQSKPMKSGQHSKLIWFGAKIKRVYSKRLKINKDRLLRLTNGMKRQKTV